MSYKNSQKFSDSDSSENSSSESSSESLGLRISNVSQKNINDELFENMNLFFHSKIIKERQNLFKSFEQISMIKGDDVILGVIGIAPYSKELFKIDFENLKNKDDLIEKTTKNIYKGFEKDFSADSCIFLDFISNIPLKNIVELYENIKLVQKKKYLICSKMIKLSNNEMRNVSKEFSKDFSKSVDLHFIPSYPHEIFLMEYYKPLKFEGERFGCFLFGKSEFEKFLNQVKSEL